MHKPNISHRHSVRFIYLLSGVICLLVGLIGIIVPLLPTTPFILLAAFCFSRSSRWLHQKLIQHKIFGPIIDDWQRYGVIPRKVKWLATVMVLVMISYPLVTKPFALWIKLTIVLCMAGVLTFIWRRPSDAKDTS